jgi:FkbH-like protein
MPAHESIRLVIWDLDETFWSGTLSEDGIQDYSERNHDIVMALAKRGIISSICSKNDFAAVEAVLRERGIWDYFILPSIDWSAKGLRLKELVEDIQLRPESVLFIDDNPGNRAEAVAHVPGLQVADISIIPDLLTLPACRGKDDDGLNRLKQYQLLQRRKTDARAAGDDNLAFLRGSNIRVAIEPNIGAHLDRAIELINRTNQLNFTKARLPDDPDAARQALLKQANLYFHQAGLVRVWDDYGDYGFCGIYIALTLHGKEELRHFCFSCRILGMGVERWLYERLGKPKITVAAPVAGSLDGDPTVDWINRDVGGAFLFVEGDVGAPPPVLDPSMQRWIAPEVRMHGGCDLDALSHYLRQETPLLHTATNYAKGAFLVRQDTTANVLLSKQAEDPAIADALDALDLFDPAQKIDFFAPAPPNTFFVLSCWGDLYVPHYRHNKLGFTVGLALRAYEPGAVNLTQLTPQRLGPYIARHVPNQESQVHLHKLVARVQADYTYLGRASNADLNERWQKIFGRIPSDCMLAVLLPNSRRGIEKPAAEIQNSMVREIAQAFPNVFCIDTTPYITATDRQQGFFDHLDRMVYFNIYKDMLQQLDMKRSLPTPNGDQDAALMEGHSQPWTML